MFSEKLGKVMWTYSESEVSVILYTKKLKFSAL